MKVKYSKSGGWSGIRRVELDTNTLDASAAKKLEELVKVLPADSTPRRGSAQGRDVGQHEIIIEEGGAPRRFVFDDLSVPPEASPLVEYLSGRSAPARPA